jgi:hypothetical protein
VSRLRPRLTYANVMATIAVFIALGGASYAALKLPKNSVGTKQLKKNSVVTAKVKKEAITAAKVKKGTLTGSQINVSTLGTVPTAQTALTAETANAIAAPEAYHEVGASAFMNGWHNKPPSAENNETVGFYKDREGVVHLKGTAEGGTKTPVFHLPAGYRPASGKVLRFSIACTGGPCGVAQAGLMLIAGPGVVPGEDGSVLVLPGAIRVSFDGVTFRAES